MAKGKTIEVKGRPISLYTEKETDYISLTDIAKYRDQAHTDDIIKNWLKNRNSTELLGYWELLNNPDSKPVEFDGFRKQEGLQWFCANTKKLTKTTQNV